MVLERSSENGYGYLNGRDGSADERSTQKGYINNFESALAAQIRGATQSVEGHPKEYRGKVLTVYSTGNLCDDIHWTTKEVPVGAVIHIQLEGVRLHG